MKKNVFFVSVMAFATLALVLSGCKKENNDPSLSQTTAGKFSVSSGKQVTFAPANLQYDLSHSKWQFAAHQWSVIGEANGVNITNKSGVIDLFCWSGSEAGNYGISDSQSSSDYSGSFKDWGSNPDLIASLGSGWRTLTQEEWAYLINERENHNVLRAYATVHDHIGLILLPDGMTSPAVRLNTSCAEFSDNYIYDSDWVKLENAGAVFLPVNGHRFGSVVIFLETTGTYSSATPGDFGFVYVMVFSAGELIPKGTASRANGNAVRLVKNAN